MTHVCVILHKTNNLDDLYQGHAFTKEEQELAIIAKALSHPACVASIKLLAKQKTCISGNKVNKLPSDYGSQHLQELKENAE